MSTYKRILEDLKEGEHLDTYATAFCAFFLIIASILGWITDDKILFNILLGSLALISISHVKNRFMLEDIYKNLSSKGKINELFPNYFRNKIKKSNEIWFIGIHHSSFMTDYYNELQFMLNNGGKVSVILADPEGEAMRMTSLRFAGGVPGDQEKKRTEANLELFKNLKKKIPGHVEIKLLDYLFEYSCVFVDGDFPDGEAFLQRYTFRVKGGSRKPKIIYKPTDGEWYTLIKSEFKSFWEVSSDT